MKNWTLPRRSIIALAFGLLTTVLTFQTDEISQLTRASNLGILFEIIITFTWVSVNSKQYKSSKHSSGLLKNYLPDFHQCLCSDEI